MKIQDFKVQSFVTDLKEEVSLTVMGGISGGNGWCKTGWAVCASQKLWLCEHPSDDKRK